MGSNDNENWRKLHHVTAGKMDTLSLKHEYDQWSKNYNQDLDGAGYRGPAIGARKVSELVPEKDCRILDVGCGTGMVGEELSKLGFTNIEGVDISEPSCEVARETGCYKDFHICDIDKNGLPGNKDMYDVIVCAGTFVPGHLNQAVFPEFCRVVKPGGYIVISMREEYLYTGSEFRGGQMDVAIVELAEKKTWNYVSRERVDGFIDVMPGALFTFQVC